MKVGHVALDGTKIKANASKHKAMSYERMDQRIRELKDEVAELMARAQETDAAEDKKYGKEKRGDELPEELRFKQSRIERIRAAKAEIETRKKEESARREKNDHDGPPGGSVASDAPPVKPEPRVQYNFTDPDSRIMPDTASKSFEQAYNAQIAADCDSQIILACGVCQSTNDKGQFMPLFQEIERNTGQIPDRTLADAGYSSRENVEFAAHNWTEPLIAWIRTKHGDKP